MKCRSFCSGIGAPEVAWKRLGWRGLTTCELEPQPSAVLAHHHPEARNLGDMTTCLERMDDEYADVFVAGTPCQSFSVAGLRAGMADPRGNLALVFLGLVDRRRPEWVVWENVPGVLSSGGGRDFGAFLGALAELGYGFAYRVLDAQFVRVDSHARAVPQRRQRVFVVGHLGDWRRAAAVLLERESLRGDPAPRRKAGEGTSGAIEAGADGEVCASVTSKWAKGSGRPAGDECQNLVAPCLRTNWWNNSDPGMEAQMLVFDEVNITSKANRSRVEPGLPCPTLHSQPMTIAFYPTNRQPEFANYVEVSPLVKPGSSTGGNPPGITCERGVRRLTPLECERLQGFPDGYTQVPYRGKPMADGPRYKMIGNSMATNVMSWIGQRIEMVGGAP